jgi:FdhD protein
MSTQYDIQRFHNGEFSPVSDLVASEEPLEIRIERRSVAVLMRSPGADIDLAMGFLFTEGVIEDAEDIQAIAHIIEPLDGSRNSIDTVLSSGVPAKRRHLADRNLFASSSCGVCGKATIERIFIHSPPLSNTTEIPTNILLSLPEKLRLAQRAFEETGGIHAAALFTMDGTMLVLREDIGRHNAVDKVIGHCLRMDLPMDNLLLLVSGRVGFEIAQKSLVARIPIIAAIGAPSSMAVDLCREGRISLYGFLKLNRVNHYSSSESSS